MIPGIDEDSFVGTAKIGDTVHLPCPLTNVHQGLISLYEVRWRKGDIDIAKRDPKYIKQLNHTLVIRDFDEDDTESSFYCYIRMIGTDDLGGEYPVSGPRRLAKLGEFWREEEGKRWEVEGSEREGWKEGSGNWAAKEIVFFSFNDDISPDPIPVPIPLV